MDNGQGSAYQVELQAAETTWSEVFKHINQEPGPITTNNDLV